MLHSLDDHAKRRLTAHEDILTAIVILLERGCPEDDLVTEMTKLFYLDLDAFNAVIASAGAQAA